MYIGEGVPYVHRGRGYPMYTFGQKSRTEPEYPLLRGPSASGTQLGVLGGPSPRGLSQIWPGKGHFGVFEAILTPLGHVGPLWTAFGPILSSVDAILSHLEPN